MGWLLLLQLTVLSRSEIVVLSKFLVEFFMLSSCFLDFSVSVGAFVIGLSHVSSFFSYLLSCFLKFRSVVSEKSKVSLPIRGQGSHLGFLFGQKYINLVACCQVSLNSVQRFQRNIKNLSQSIRGKGSHLGFPISP